MMNDPITASHCGVTTSGGPTRTWRRAHVVLVMMCLPLVAAGCPGDDDVDVESEVEEATEASDLPMTGDPSVSDGNCPAKVQVSSTDVSSVAIYVLTQRSSPTAPWCDTISISRITAAATEAVVAADGCWSSWAEHALDNCPYKGLAAVEIGPDTDFTFYANGSRPDLVYDLTPGGSTSTFECEAIIDQTGGDCDPYLELVEKTLPFAFYRYRSDAEIGSTTLSRWAFAGTAKLTAANIASGEVNHFSTMVLVELPEPTQVTGGVGGGTIIGSPFDSGGGDDNGTATDLVVAVRMEDGPEMVLSPGAARERIVHLQGFVQLEPTDLEVGECSPDDVLVEFLSCAFPTGAEVEIAWDGADLFTIRSERSGVQLRASGGVAIY